MPYFAVFWVGASESDTRLPQQSAQVLQDDKGVA